MTLRRARPFWAKKKAGGAGLPYTPPLDVFSNASAAYSVRKLRSAYTGPCMRVADSSDNQVDIGFDENGLVDISAIEAFVGINQNAYVVTWYDQSGNGNDANGFSSNSSRKQISFITTGIRYLNGIPAIYGNNSGAGAGAKSLTFTSPIDIYSLFAAGARVAAQNTDQITWHGSNVEGIFLGGTNGSATGFGCYVNSSFGPQNTIEDFNQRLWEYFYSSGTSYVYTNGSNSASKVTGLISAIEMGRTTANGGGTNNSANADIQEFIVFSDDKLAVKSGIESNINSYFSIY